ncbi:hypothetical protein BDY19DRAFT_995182 [Irpex rosettiformis]|uniref:Uncharacterized protein n=1 Tax=Irpex rosettiformis TaxID=378272 RepID=A0ACB8TYF5_9APHY|nr:hypothetical protein BDY19DRAFT_995182 [Irpex rosettiformis]
MSPRSFRDEGEGEEAGCSGIMTTGVSDRVFLRTVDWAYHRQHLWTETGEKLPSHPRPPFYQEFFHHHEEFEQEIMHCPQDEEVELNSSLVGVLGAEGAVKWYEIAVGIAYEPNPSSIGPYQTRRPLFLGGLSEEECTATRSGWGTLVDELLGGIFKPGDFTVTLDPDFGTNFMSYETGSLSDMSTDSDSDPLPTTPDGDQGFVDASFEGIGYGSSFSPSSKPLNAAAVSFIPSYGFEPSPPPISAESYDLSAYEFHFPSLTKQTTNRNESRSVPPPFQRDEHGFYTEVVSASVTRSSTPRRQSGRAPSRLLDDPASPSRPRSASKTRELVDQLRSSAPSRRQRKKKSEISSLRHSSAGDNVSMAADERAADEANGWIMGVDGIGSAPGSDRQENWVQGLFQCRSPSHSRSKKRSKHERSSSTSTAHTSTPTSASSLLSTLPSPATSMSSIRPPSKPPIYNGPLPPLQPFVPFVPSYVAYPGLIPSPMVPASTMMGLPPQPWHLPMPPVMPPAVYSTPMPMFVHRS